MEAHQHDHAILCRCGGEAKVFGPSEFAPNSQWEVYCSKDGCEIMATGNDLKQSIETWNEEQMFAIY